MNNGYMPQLMLLYLILSLLSCNESTCPADQYLGKVNLRPESIAKLPFADKTKLFYRNAEGEEITYWVNHNFHEQNLYQLTSMGKRCGMGGTRTEVLMDAELIRVSLRQGQNRNDFSLDFSLCLKIQNKNLADPLDTVLVDEIQIQNNLNNIHYITQIPIQSKLNIIASERGNELTPEDLSEIDFNPKKTLLDKAFSEVYFDADASPLIYYNFQIGIIGFEDKSGKLWVLDRFE